MKTSVHALDNQSRPTLMRRTSKHLGLLVIVLAAAIGFGAMPIRATGVVADCTDQAFRAALVGGGASVEIETI